MFLHALPVRVSACTVDRSFNPLFLLRIMMALVAAEAPNMLAMMRRDNLMAGSAVSADWPRYLGPANKSYNSTAASGGNSDLVDNRHRIRSRTGKVSDPDHVSSTFFECFHHVTSLPMTESTSSLVRLFPSPALPLNS